MCLEVMCLFYVDGCERNRGCPQSTMSIEVSVGVCVEGGPLFWQADQCSGCCVPISVVAEEPGLYS